MTDQEAPKIKFPCPDYIIKIMGDAGETFQADVEAIVRKLAPDLDSSRTQCKASAKGNYLSVNVWITAQSPEHLKAIHEALIADNRVKMVI